MSEYSRKTVAEMRKNDKIESILSVHYTKPVQEYRFGTMFEIRVSDRTGQITVKFWGGDDPAKVLQVYDSLGKDCVVRIRGTVGEYRGQLELAVNPKEDEGVWVLKEGEYDIRELIPCREDIPQLVDRFYEMIKEVKDTHYSALLSKIFDDKEFMKHFSEYPASLTLHSNELGGLIYHTLNVADHCLLSWEQHNQMDRDLLIAGALLHDVGKVDSFVVTTNIDQTPTGIFLGHLVIGTAFVQSKIEEIADFPEDKRNKILHVILSHHGRKEWGSPVEPAIPEALAVHFADDFDAKLDYMLVRRKEASTDDDWIWDSRFRRHIWVGDQ
ncbi:MAG: HD domain-containing protein [Thermoplasmata archaeon]|nr:HD domain-containing protein [Thermoplasmata archaeon]